MQRIIKSVFWLVGCGGLGYVLLELTQPSQSKIAEIRKSSQFTSQFTAEQNRNTQLFLDRLKESSKGK